LSKLLDVLTRLQASAVPTFDIDAAVIPSAMWREFVDAHAAALYEEAHPTELRRIVIRTNADGTLDEAILADGVAHFHLEQMAAEHWWMALTLDKQRIDINLWARGRIKANVSDEGEVKLIDDANAIPSSQPQKRSEE